MITLIKKFLANRLKRDQILIAHNDLLVAHSNLMMQQGNALVATLERMESLFGNHTRACRIVADLMPSKADRQEFLDEVAKLETSSEAMELHIANLKRAVSKSNCPPPQTGGGGEP